MKALTFHQPWPILIEAGVKWLETRPRPMSYTGRLAVHSSTNDREFRRIWNDGHRHAIGDDAAIVTVLHRLGVTADTVDLVPDQYFWAITASVLVTACVPIVRAGPCTDDEAEDRRRTGMVVVAGPGAEPAASYYRPRIQHHELSADVTDQLAYGDFTPGRYAIVLTDPAGIRRRCPYCWNLSKPTYDIGWDALAESLRHRPCPVCVDGHPLAPIPARGQQATPWNWYPTPEEAAMANTPPRLSDFQARLLGVVAAYDNLSRGGIRLRMETTRSQATRAINALLELRLLNEYPTKADHVCATDTGRAWLRAHA